MSSPLQTAFTGKCPACEQGPMFSGVFMMREHCPECGAVFFRDPGSWTGSTAVAYMAGSVYACLVLMVLWATGQLATAPMWLVPTVVCGLTLLTYRFTKALWVGILYGMEQVYADPGGPPAPAPRKKRLDRPTQG